MRLNRFPLLTSSIVFLMCTACASQPERRGPPAGERGGTAGANYTGMAVKPIGLFFATMDRDQDAIVDPVELDLGVTYEWDRLSSDDYASALDFEAWSLIALGSKNTLPSFIAFDHDLDGRLTQEDFSKRMRFEFDRLDVDNSGTLDRSELLFRISRPSRDSRGSGQDGRSRGAAKDAAGLVRSGA